MKNLFSSKPVSVEIKQNWNILLQGVQYTVHIVNEKCLFGLLRWHESDMVAGPFPTRQDAKRAAAEVRKKFYISPTSRRTYDK